MAASHRACQVCALALLFCAIAVAVHAARLAPEQHILSTEAGDGVELELERRGRTTECENPKFRKTVLRVIKEIPFIGLFKELPSVKFEASGMTVAKGWLWIVFDNLHAIARVDEHFHFRDEHNKLLGEVGEDSQFEGLSFQKSTGHFYAVQEVVDDESHGLVPYVKEIKMNEEDNTYEVIKHCVVHYTLSHGNKGFEGLHLHEDDKGNEFLFGLCEGNFCKGGRAGKVRGNGRIVVTEYQEEKDENGDDHCSWEVVKVVEIPSTAYFQDYSGLAFRGDKVAIVSQEESAMYVSYFDFERLEFTPEKGEWVYNFPRNDHCELVYCNVEGVEWLDDYRLAIASDKAKRYQPFRCTAKDQTLAIFALPG